MKANLIAANVKERIVIRDDTAYGIQNYDVDNAYPQRMAELVASSGIATVCCDVYGKYIMGQGFKDKDFYKSDINRSQTTDKLLRLLVDDYKRFKGFAIHVNYNLNLRITELNYIPFEHCRLCLEDDLGYVSKIAIHPNWERNKYKKKLIKGDVKFIDVYNPYAVPIQVERDGIENYKGQIFYYSAESGTYPKSSIDAERLTVETDDELQHFNYNNAAHSFLATHIMVTRGNFESEGEKRQFLENIKNFQGGKNASRIFHVESELEEGDPKVIKVDQPNNEKLFEQTHRLISERVRRLFGIPTVLMESIPGSLGGEKQLAEARKYYNDLTSDERMVFEETFKELCTNFYYDINKTNDYSIIPIETGALNIPAEYLGDLTQNERRLAIGFPELDSQKAQTQILAQTLGVGGTQALMEVLQGTLPAEQKINSLVILFGLTPDQAILMVGKNTENVN